MTTDRACRFAGLFMRSGGATCAASNGLSLAEISHLAGVKDANWLTYYNRDRQAYRIPASRAFGSDEESPYFGLTIGQFLSHVRVS